MTAWSDIEQWLANVNQTNYGSNDPKATDRQARDAIRKLVLNLERQAAERDSLRELLLDQGRENAWLRVELEQARVQLASKAMTEEDTDGLSN